jgi:hypothetical protein
MFKQYMEFYNTNYFSATMLQVSSKSRSTCNFANVVLSPAIMHHFPCTISLPLMMSLHGRGMIWQGLDGSYATHLKIHTTLACKQTCVIIKANCKAMLRRARHTQHNDNSNLQVQQLNSNCSQNSTWKSN